MSRHRDDQDRTEGDMRHLLTVLILLGFCLLLMPSCQQNMGGVRGRSPAEVAPRESQARHHYRYFPESAVYMDTGRRLFYYKKGEKWLSTTILPADIQVDWKNFVVVELDTDKPYLFHAETARKYPRRSAPRVLPNRTTNKADE